jgi:dipeptide/tripeptide permease
MILGKAFGFLKGFVGYQATTTGLILSAATGLGYSFPILGAVVADCWFGKYVAIISFLVIYICGMLIMTLSAVETLGLSSEICYFIGFFLISAGSGTIKPCLITLGGDQFTLPQQKKQVNFFYYAYYFLGNLGIGCGFLVASEIVIMNCNNNEYCYSASFGLAAILLTTFFSKDRFE